MLPGNVASSLGISGLLLPPDDNVTSGLEDYEMGGVALNNSSQGFLVQSWRCFVDSGTNDVRVQAGTNPATTIFTQPGITALALAFDQNMRPTIAYVVADQGYLRWYDSSAGAFVVTAYPGIRNPRLSLDDKRASQYANNSDIIFAYIRGTSLYYRQQRDRFLIERLLRTGVLPTQTLRNIGMMSNYRMLFELA